MDAILLPGGGSTECRTHSGNESTVYITSARPCNCANNSHPTIGDEFYCTEPANYCTTSKSVYGSMNIRWRALSTRVGKSYSHEVLGITSVGRLCCIWLFLLSWRMVMWVCISYCTVFVRWPLRKLIHHCITMHPSRHSMRLDTQYHGASLRLIYGSQRASTSSGNTIAQSCQGWLQTRCLFDLTDGRLDIGVFDQN